ncbi:MAG TPA: hypothetical protein VF167_05135 [Longimicrobiaceae bacterium]
MTLAGGSREGEARSIFVVTAPGLERVAARELLDLGISGEVQAGGVEVRGGRSTLYDLNLRLRSASRVLVRIAEFRARTFFELERHGARVPWKEYIAPGRPVRVRVTSRKSKLYHEGAIEERLLRAIGSEAAQGGAEETEGEAEQLFVVRTFYDRFLISVDSSGALLHRRGYRQALARAPLRESVGAALLLASGWDAREPLLDPFCGSGTIPIEAALIARRIAPGLASRDRSARNYAFRSWPEFDADLFDELVARCREEELPTTPVRIAGSDRDAGAVAAALANAGRAGLENDVEITQRPLSAASPAGDGGWIVTNPPYGARVGKTRALRDLYAALGKVAPRLAPSGRLVLLSAHRVLEAQTGLPLHELFSTRNGGIPVRALMSDCLNDGGGSRRDG